jgi:hypothetical protein
MRERLRVAAADSEAAYHKSLLYAGEFILKMSVASLVAAVRQDPDGHQYRFEHKLVSASGLGEWADVLDEVLTGTPARLLPLEARGLRRQLTETAPPGDWRARTIELLESARCVFEPKGSGAIRRPQLRQWGRLFVAIRNKTRGHGAPLTAREIESIPYLSGAIDLLSENYNSLGLSWAYLRRRMNGSGYLVVPLRDGDAPFSDLRKDAHIVLDDGLYVDVGGPCHVRLVYTDPELQDYWVANGSFGEGTYEVLSYITGDTRRLDSGRYSRPPAPLPLSETHGTNEVTVRGNVFTTMPSPPAGYVPRLGLEGELANLLSDDYHPVLTLRGRGGIGKTSLALAVLDTLALEDRFDSIWWFSARDIDLLPEGVRPVRQGVVAADDIALAHWQFTHSPGVENPKGENLLRAFASSLAHQAGPTRELFVFDNFETIAGQVELFRWLEAAARNPNKVLITTRERTPRGFTGDYAVEVGGMLDEEFSSLVRSAARQLGVEGLITEDWIRDAYAESDGHPYVAKILVNEVRRTGKIGNIPRILADKEEILTALFERTFTKSLSPEAQRVFLTLCGWRSRMPEVAVKAALLRPSNERIDVDRALDELVDNSMLEPVDDPDGERWFVVPGAAQLFGQAKLATSPERATILADVAVLHAFGAAQDSDIRRGVSPRIENLIRWATQHIEADGEGSEAFAVLEYVASRFPRAWLSIADVRRGLRQPEEELHAARRYVEAAPGEPVGWRRLAGLYQRAGDSPAEMEATLQLVALPGTPYREMSNLAARFTSLVRDGELQDLEARSFTAKRIRRLMEGRLSEADPTDLSRLGWVCVQMKDYDRAVELANQGLAKDPNNAHCQRLAAFRW